VCAIFAIMDVKNITVSKKKVIFSYFQTGLGFSPASLIYLSNFSKSKQAVHISDYFWL